MIKVLVTLILTFSFQFSYAEDDLASYMEVIGQNFGMIAKALKAGAVSQEELTASEDLQVAVDEASQFIPDTADSEELENEYMELMVLLSEKAQELRDAIELEVSNQTGDLSSIQTLFDEMNEIRIQGHFFK